MTGWIFAGGGGLMAVSIIGESPPTIIDKDATYEFLEDATVVTQHKEPSDSFPFKPTKNQISTLRESIDNDIIKLLTTEE